MALSKFETTPSEVLEEIVLWVVASSFLGPPDILALLRVSKHIWNDLTLRHNAYLYARVFDLKFDVNATVNRLSGRSRHLELSTELVRRFESLKRLKNHGHVHQHDTINLKSDLWTAYFMFLESDTNNSRQLIQYANVDRFASSFVSLGGPLHYGADTNGGWTVDSEENALALWLFWFTDKQRVRTETPAERRKVLQALAPLFVGTFKYASTVCPVTSFGLPPITPPALNLTPAPLSLATSPVSPRSILPNHFGLELTISRPLLMPPALLSCVVRLEAAIAKMDWPLSASIPATRHEAVAIGWSGPTREDHTKQKVPTTKFVEWEGRPLASQRHEQDWLRLRPCFKGRIPRHLQGGMFTPGMLDGVWVGRWFGIPINQFNDILQAEQLGQSGGVPHPPLVYPVPMQFRLREHHQRDRDEMVGFEDISTDGTGKGVFNAWLPTGTTMKHTDGCLKVYVPNHTPITYRDYDAATWDSLDEELAHEAKDNYEDGVRDVILTAETDEDFAQAWGHKRYYGRFRAWDGLIVLVREATDNEGRWMFRGYLHGMQNLVGLWRETATQIESPAWEGVWSMTKI